MIPFHLHVKRDHRKDHKNHQCDYLLQYLQLHQTERATIPLKPDTIGGHLQAIFKKCYAPGDGYHTYQRQALEPRKLSHLQMAIPRQCHKHIRRHQKQYCIKTIHNLSSITSNL